jgi:hypothetical protein
LFKGRNLIASLSHQICGLLRQYLQTTLIIGLISGVRELRCDSFQTSMNGHVLTSRSTDLLVLIWITTISALGGLDKLVPQMINFVEELPAEWQPQWELMQITAAQMGKRRSMFVVDLFKSASLNIVKPSNYRAHAAKIRPKVPRQYSRSSSAAPTSSHSRVNKIQTFRSNLCSRGTGHAPFVSTKARSMYLETGRLRWRLS